MKKLVSALILVAMMIGVILPVCAAEEKIGWDEAKELYIKAFVRCSLLHLGEFPDTGAYGAEDAYSPIFYIGPNYSDVEGLVSKSFSESSAGKKYSKEYTYYEVRYELFESVPKNTEITLQYLRDYGNEAMTESLTERAMQSKRSDSGDIVEIFRTDKESGKLLQEEHTGAVQMWITYDIASRSSDGFVDIVSLSSNSKYAIMHVVMYKNASGITTTTVPTTETVIFENTKNGWRVSGGSVFDVIIDNKSPTYCWERTEFEVLAKSAFDSFVLIQHQYVLNYALPAYTDPEILADDTIQYEYKIPHLGMLSGLKPDAEKLSVAFTSSSDGAVYSEEKRYALAVQSKNYETDMDLGFRSVASISEYGNRVMTKDLTARAMLNVSDGVELYRDHEGQLLLYTAAFPSKLYNKYALAEYGALVMLSDTTATMSVTLKIYEGLNTSYTRHTESIDFVKTTEGWRVCGGSAFEVMLGTVGASAYMEDEALKFVGDLDEDYSPNTSDSTWVKLAVLAFGILCSTVAFYLCVLKKNRRDLD